MKKIFISLLFFLFFTSQSYACSLLTVSIGTPITTAETILDFLRNYKVEIFGKKTVRYTTNAIDYCEGSSLENADLEVLVYDSKVVGINVISSDSEIKNEIYEFVKNYFSDRNIVKNKNLKALVTAGPTKEYIDPVRFITNNSSGKQGYEIASSLAKFGVETTLISGPSALKKPENVNVIASMEIIDEGLLIWSKGAEWVLLDEKSGELLDRGEIEFDYVLEKVFSSEKGRLLCSSEGFVLWLDNLKSKNTKTIQQAHTTC